MSRAMKALQKGKRKAAAKDRVFGCDLVEHLQLSGLDVPQVLKTCTEFVEQHGVVDGIYRLSGVSSNIQKLRLEFDTDRKPDLNKAIYLQDIHCVSSLCKAYFRELPNPLLTYQLYDKFADAVALQLEEARLDKIKEVLKELPAPHYRTLEFLMKHLVHMASFSTQTNMHIRNLAIVWAPNLLRSKDIETSGFNGTAAFMEVRIQSIVVEFILTHVDQIFENAPLCNSSRESLRKSLLLMGSPVTFVDDKYSFACNIPAVLNQGDGPPQMRPYHTIIELADGKRKGSLKAKKWRSIFNLGRSGNDSRRKLLKPEEKEKESKMRLRPAKSMDSLSSVPCEDDVRLGRKKSQKLSQCSECFDGPVSLDSSFLVSDEYPRKFKVEETQAESEGEASAKSEPTTPKISRSSLVGAAPQGRSPKASQNRAEKCVGVRISGPFSATVPFHITSNLTLSRLTRGLECPALTHCAVEKDVLENAEREQDETLTSKDITEDLMPGESVDFRKSANADAEVANLSDTEKNRISMEVQDSFSFLDSQDPCLGENTDGEQQSRKNSRGALDFAGRDVDHFSITEDETGSGFMNEMIGGGMQMGMFSGVPPLDYLSIEECMNELSEDEDDQYYLAMGCEDNEDLPKEADADEVYLSAFDELCPLASELKHLQLPRENQRPDACLPGNAVEDQPFSLVGEICLRDPADMDPFLASLSACDPGLIDSYYDPGLSDLLEEDLDTLQNAGESLRGLESPIHDEAEATRFDSSSSSLQEDGVNTGDGKDLLPEIEVLAEAKCPGAILEHSDKHSAFPEYIPEPILENEWELTQKTSEIEQDPWPSCLLSSEPDRTIAEGDAMPYHHAACKFPFPEEKLQDREPFSYPLTAESPLSLEGPVSLGAPLSSLLDNCSPKDSSESTPGFPPPLSGFPPAPPSSPTLDCCLESDPLLLVASSAKGGPESLLAGFQPVETSLMEVPEASGHDLPDGSVHMKLTSSTVRVQQVKSFPVIPPKPQFAKIPPSLAPITPAKEESTGDPDTGYGNRMKAESSEASFHPTSLDRSPSVTESAQRVEIPPASSEQPIPLGNCQNNSGTLQKQRNSMPASLEKYSTECETRDITQNSLLSQYSLCSKPNEFSHGDFEHAKSSLGVVLDNHTKGDTRNQLPGPVFQEKHPVEAMPPKQKWTTWRNGGSMSFDEAVALAKERHGAQAPVRRMQTYCCGEAEGHSGSSKLEKPPPNLKPALKVLGQRPLRPLSCLGAMAYPEALAAGKGLPAQAMPEVTPEGQLFPNKEALFPLQEPSPRKRLSLQNIGRRFSTSDEAPCNLSEWR